MPNLSSVVKTGHGIIPSKPPSAVMGNLADVRKINIMGNLADVRKTNIMGKLPVDPSDARRAQKIQYDILPADLRKTTSIYDTVPPLRTDRIMYDALPISKQGKTKVGNLINEGYSVASPQIQKVFNDLAADNPYQRIKQVAKQASDVKAAKRASVDDNWKQIQQVDEIQQTAQNLKQMKSRVTRQTFDGSKKEAYNALINTQKQFTKRVDSADQLLLLGSKAANNASTVRKTVVNKVLSKANKRINRAIGTLSVLGLIALSVYTLQGLNGEEEENEGFREYLAAAPKTEFASPAEMLERINTLFEMVENEEIEPEELVAVLDQFVVEANEIGIELDAEFIELINKMKRDLLAMEENKIALLEYRLLLSDLVVDDPVLEDPNEGEVSWYKTGMGVSGIIGGLLLLMIFIFIIVSMMG